MKTKSKQDRLFFFLIQIEEQNVVDPSCQANDSAVRRCNNGKCIYVDWWCDGVDHCGDNSDEERKKCSNHTCRELEFTCSDGQCVNNRWRCNGRYDCEDKSDEIDCEEGKLVSHIWETIESIQLLRIKSLLKVCSISKGTDDSIPDPSHQNQLVKATSTAGDNKLPILALCFSLVAISIVLVVMIVLFVRHQKEHTITYNVEKESTAKRNNSQVTQLAYIILPNLIFDGIYLSLKRFDGFNFDSLATFLCCIYVYIVLGITV